MQNVPTSISKRFLWHYVNKKINRIVHHAHVLSIISILFEELLADLKAGKIIKIHNFGILTLKKMKPKTYFNVKERKFMQSGGGKVLKFTLSPKIKKKLCQHLDIDKTFKDS
jgi:nucleoid DNA-binding protein